MSALRAESDRSRPAANGTASKLSNGDTFSLGQTADHFVRRLLTECLQSASRSYWLKRAQDFEGARPRPEDFHGNADRQELRARWLDLTEVAEACRARAKVAPLDEIAPEVSDVLREVS